MSTIKKIQYYKIEKFSLTSQNHQYEKHSTKTSNNIAHQYRIRLNNVEQKASMEQTADHKIILR